LKEKECFGRNLLAFVVNLLFSIARIHLVIFCKIKIMKNDVCPGTNIYYKYFQSTPYLVWLPTLPEYLVCL
jgi:hypothetical protein